jgi:hypothetical protein
MGADTLDRLVEALASLPGVFSLHAQYAPPIVTVVALVADEKALHEVADQEVKILFNSEEGDVDLRAYQVDPKDVTKLQEALSMSHSLLWSSS